MFPQCNRQVDHLILEIGKAEEIQIFAIDDDIGPCHGYGHVITEVNVDRNK